MKVYNNTLHAIEYIEESNMSRLDKDCKIAFIKSQGMAKVDGVILVVDKYDILDID